MQSELTHLGYDWNPEDNRQQLCERMFEAIADLDAEGYDYIYSDINEDYRRLDDIDWDIIKNRIKAAFPLNNPELLHYALPYLTTEQVNQPWIKVKEGFPDLYLLRGSLNTSNPYAVFPSYDKESLGPIEKLEGKRIEEFIDVLSSYGADIYEGSFLINAVLKRDEKLIRFLLDYGINPNVIIRTHYGPSTWFNYALNQMDVSPQLAQDFLDYGANIHQINSLSHYVTEGYRDKLDTVYVLLNAGVTQEEIREAYNNTSDPQIKLYLQNYLSRKL
jgi:hypothetical protein